MKIVDIPEYTEEQLAHNEFLRLFSDQNNFSYWFEKVKSCGIAVPNSIIIPVPEEMLDCFYMERKDDGRAIYDWVCKEVYPKRPSSLVFVKNGAFSNKFNFSDCAPPADVFSLTSSIINIQYTSLCYETGGNTEIVLRERVGLNDEVGCYRIYNGMPLRPEFRVFYDFDLHRALYVINYWDWDYCYEAIAGDKTDGLVYEAAYPAIKAFYEEHKQEAMFLVDTHMKNVSGLSGIWSVDLMWADGKYWLIDMAIGKRSAYYDPERIAALSKEAV